MTDIESISALSVGKDYLFSNLPKPVPAPPLHRRGNLIAAQHLRVGDRVVTSHQLCYVVRAMALQDDGDITLILDGTIPWQHTTSPDTLFVLAPR